MFKLNDFFCGAGGIGLGFQRQGFEVVGAWDINAHAIKSYLHNVDKSAKVADILSMTYLDVPYAEVWTFGFPCQDVSLANPDGEGLEGARSGLFYEVMRLLRETRLQEPTDLPQVIMAENVLNVKRHLGTIEEEYKKVGYKLLYTVLDSQDFGLAQHRKRYMLVGVRDDLDASSFTFPDYSHFTPLGRSTVQEVLQPDSEIADNFFLSDKAIAYMDRHRKGKPRWEYHRNPLDGVAATVTANIYKGVPYGVLQTSPPRRFTPRECARLQGFPDTYEQVISNTQFYMAMGNAVSVPVAETMAQHIEDFLKEANL